MKNKYIHILRVEWDARGERQNNILGVYADMSGAKDAMQKDISQMKRDWDSIDFNNPAEWEVECDEGSCYQAHDPDWDYQYEIWIETKVIR